MCTRELLCAITLLATAQAEDCLPWLEGTNPVGIDAAEASRKYLRAAVQQHPFDVQLHTRIGQMLFDGQCYDLALSEMLRARILGQSSPDFLLRLASAENILGAFSDAAADADSVASLQGLPAAQRASAAALAGVAFASMGRDEMAIARFRQSVEAGPQLENSTLMLADLLAKKGLNAQAAGVLREFVGRNPSSPEAWARLARTESGLGNPARARECWTRVRQLNAEYPMVDSMLAQAMLADKDPDLPAVLRVLQRAGQKSPQDSDVLYYAGKTLATMGRYAEAAKSLEAAVRLQPLESNLYYQLGLVYRKLGRAQLARKQFEIMQYLRTAQQGR